MQKARRRWQKVAFAFVDLDVDSFGHVAANVLTGAALCIHFCLRRLVQIVWVEANDSAVDILNNKRLPKCNVKRILIPT